jgi:5,10-methylenetetrahydromethanopterin reductase
MEYGINFNGDVIIDKITKAAILSEEAGFSHIWVGETTGFLHPFPLMAACLENTGKIVVGAGIISPLRNRPHHILKAALTFEEVYGPRVSIGLAPGDHEGLKRECTTTKKVLGVLSDASTYLKGNSDLKVYIGASGPKLIKLAGEKSDGVLLNYVYPEYVKWALKFLKKDVYKAVYGPSLLLPNSKLLSHLRGAAAVVLAGGNRDFLESMGLTELSGELRELVRKEKWSELKKYDKILFERFTISGDVYDFQDRLEEYKKLGIDQVILATPFGRDIKGIREMTKVISST